ncbi:MAG: response regulator, partial [Bacteroidales bacterium]
LRSTEQQLQATNQQLIANSQQLMASEASLRKSEAKFKSYIKNAPDGIFIANEKGEYIEVNETASKITGYSEDELRNVTIPDLIQKEYLEKAEWHFQKTIKDGFASTDLGFVTKSGEKRFWNIDAVKLSETRFLGFAKDITERKQDEIELCKAKEKAEETDRLKSAFLANMSHEIRTPMNGILGFADLLKEPKLTGDQKDKYIQVIEKSGERMLNTINDIIDISKIEAGEVEVENTELSVNKILDEQYEFFAREAVEKGLELNYYSALSDNESRIITDKHKLESIIGNLIKNAIKYTETGSITFGYSIQSLKGKNFFEFYITDTGIGIPADRINAIFNRFEQADIEDTRVFEGSGLGLAISKSYVKMLGGEMSVRSTEGSGSTFMFSIPYNKEFMKKENLDNNNENLSQIALHNLSVIVAEDDENSRMYFDTLFKHTFKKIHFTTTGNQTIDACREHPDTDIILMDIKMPDINGYQATQQIRKFNTDVIIIAQTAYGLLGDKEKAIEAGCDDYLSKPVKKEILFEKIRACVAAKKSR